MISTVLIANVNAALVVDATTRIQRGKYALRIRSPAPAMAFTALVVDSTKNVQSTMPSSSCTGKSVEPGPVPAALRSTLKTRYMIPNSIRGFTSDHTYPRAEPVYFSLNWVIESSRTRLTFL